TSSERTAIQSRLQVDYTAFHYVFTLTAPSGVGDYATLFFNKTPVVNGLSEVGGLADEIDFPNVNLGGTVAIDVNGLLGGDLEPAATSDNFVALSSEIAAHELGHLVGLQHADSFGPIGLGIHNPPGADALLPLYPGPALAFETAWHIMASPASVGTSLDDAVGNTFFGEREDVKLAFDESGTIVPEQVTSHGSLATAQPVNLYRLNVPNTLLKGLDALKQFAVAAVDVSGSIAIDPSTSASENDYYSFS